MTKEIATLSGPCREKYWSELDSDGRTERLRTVTKRLMHQLDDARRTISKLKEAAERHEHSPATGMPVLSVKPANEWANEAAADRRPEKPDECYI